MSSFVFLADVIANGMWQMFLPLQCIATIDWLMLLPSGRWNSHILLICFHCCMGRCYCPVADGMATFCIFVMADVIAQWQMEWPLQGVTVSLLVDVVPRGQMDICNYFSLSSEVLCRTSSHIYCQ